MQHTTNYNLNQYEAADIVTCEDFNADNAAIDAAIAAVAAAAAGSAKIETFAYTGTGSGAPSFAFQTKPAFFIIFGYRTLHIANELYIYAFTRDSEDATDNTLSLRVIDLRWSGNTATFYSSSSMAVQANTANSPYRVLGVHL